jgi:hypothetical protein
MLSAVAIAYRRSASTRSKTSLRAWTHLERFVDKRPRQAVAGCGEELLAEK